MKYLKVEGQENYVRDVESNGILNTDTDGYNAYVENYRRIYAEKKKINDIENDVNSIKNDLNEIKTLLRNLANGS